MRFSRGRSTPTRRAILCGSPDHYGGLKQHRSRESRVPSLLPGVTSCAGTAWAARPLWAEPPRRFQHRTSPPAGGWGLETLENGVASDLRNDQENRTRWHVLLVSTSRAKSASRSHLPCLLYTSDAADEEDSV